MVRDYIAIAKVFTVTGSLMWLTAGAVGCGTVQTPTHTSGSGSAAGTDVMNAGNVTVTRGHSTRAGMQMTPHTMIGVRPDIASAIDKMPGLKWTVVLVEGHRVYVASYPEYSGKAAEGAAPRTSYKGPKLFDSKAELARQSPEEWISALNLVHPTADTFDNRPKGRSGMMAPAQQQAIRALVEKAVPGVKHINISTDVASAAVLHGYAQYVQAGGDMTLYMGDFHHRIRQIWPNGKGPASDRPSASPNFGQLGRAASSQTPAQGHVSLHDTQTQG